MMTMAMAMTMAPAMLLLLRDLAWAKDLLFKDKCTQCALMRVVAPRIEVLVRLCGRSLCIDIAEFNCCVNKEWRNALYALTSLSVLPAPRRERQALHAPRP